MLECVHIAKYDISRGNGKKPRGDLYRKQVQKNGFFYGFFVDKKNYEKIFKIFSNLQTLLDNYLWVRIESFVHNGADDKKL